MLHLLRPNELLVRFELDEFVAGDAVVPAPPPPRSALLDLPYIAMQCAVNTVGDCVGSPISAATLASTSLDVDNEFFCVGVGITGALDGELWLATNPRFASRLASAYLHEETDTAEVVRDALNELLSTIAGQVGDTLEAEGYLIDVTPPIDAQLGVEPKPGEQRSTHALEGTLEPLELVVITRPRDSQFP